MVASLSLRAGAQNPDTLWPVFDGELAGKFTALKLPGAPELSWTLTLRHSEPGQRRATLVVTGTGTKLTGDVRLDASNKCFWRIEEGRLDVDAWFAAWRSSLGPEFSGVTAGGTLALSGEGSWHDGVLGGRARLSWTGGRVDDPAHKLMLEGIATEIEIVDLAARRTALAQRLTWTAGQYDVIALGAGRVVFAFDGEKVAVEEASVGAFAGELALGAFEFSVARPLFSVLAQVRGVEVAMFLPLLPPLVSEARGRLDGEVVLKRTMTGIEIGSARLSLRAGESAELKLLPTAGLLSSSLPETVRKYYPGLADLEAGKVPLKAELLEVSLTPQGDAQGRTASVRLAGGPVDPRLRAPVDLTVNVRGPLEWLINFGTDSRLHWGAGR